MIDINHGNLGINHKDVFMFASWQLSPLAAAEFGRLHVTGPLTSATSHALNHPEHRRPFMKNMSWFVTPGMT
jgi:hypothetical protein